MDPNQMLLKIACYRSYGAPLDKFVEASPWESKAQTLKSNFLDKISAQYGQGNECVEAGL